jgi:hypothetical protein
MHSNLLKPLIHIGYHKTGTTWLQDKIFSRNDRGFYPIVDPFWRERLKGQFSCQEFATNFICADDGKILTPNEFLAEYTLDKLLKFNKEKVGIPVISHERLSGSLATGAIDAFEIARRIHQTFNEGRILIVIREQKSMILSWYYQYLKSGGVLSLRKFISNPYDDHVLGFNKKCFAFHNLISLYLELFGKKNVLVLPYEMFITKPESFIDAIYGFIGAKDKPQLNYLERINENKSSWYLTNFRLLNYFTKSHPFNEFSPFYLGKIAFKLDNSLKKRVHHLIPCVLEIRNRKKHRALVDSIIGNYFFESNRETEKLINIDLKSMGYS